MSKSNVIWTALYSRFLVIGIQYVANILIPDHNPGVFRYPKPDLPNTLADQLINHFFGGFLRWDGQYFMHIAGNGYTYENSLAFFPLVPFVVRIFASFAHPLMPFLNLDSILLMSFILVNLGFFILSTIALFDLSKLVVGEAKAFKVVVLFSYNPASIFYSAPYTECIFSYLSFKCMVNCISLYNNSRRRFKFKDLSVVIIPTALSAITRSNGVLNIGFLVYTLLSLLSRDVRSYRGFKFKIMIQLFIGYSVTIIVSVVLCLVPFALFQYYCYEQFCQDFRVEFDDFVTRYGQIEGFVMPGNFSQNRQDWCFNKVPLAYSYVQSHYWNVGFLRYWEFKQIPNFLLAAPIIWVMIRGATSYFRKNWRLRNLFDFHEVMLPFVVHGTFLTVFCFFNIHVQVTTRMICSASPVFYWYLAKESSPFLNNNLFDELSSKFGKNRLVILYFSSYFVIGTALFCNDFPWT